MSALTKPITALVGVLTVLLAGLFFATSATAYPAGVAPVVSVSTTTPTCGDPVTVTGSNYQPGESVVVSDGVGDTVTVTASADGTISATLTITCSGTDPTTITATGETSSGVDAISISTTGTPASSSGSGDLSTTGVAVIGIGAVGVVLLVGGGLLLMAGKRRKVSV